MKTKPRFNQRLFMYIAGFAATILFFYTLMTFYYLSLGLDFGLKFALEAKANAYQQEYLVDPQSPLPKGHDLSSYRKIEDIPAPLRTLFAVEKMQHKEQWHYIEHVDEIPTGHPATQLPELCDGVMCEMLFIFAYQLEEGEWLYIVVAKGQSELFAAQGAELDKVVYLSIVIGFAFLILISVFAYILLRKVAQPINRLTDWADQVTLKNFAEPLPELAYQELDNLASQLQSSFKRVDDSLDNERKFLSNASHELRTPIAVQQANITLLKKLGAWQDDGTEQGKAQERILRASLNMRQLTETLLWLSRDFQALPKSHTIELSKLAQTLIDENRYLLKHKEVEVVLQRNTCALTVPENLSRIILNNLIRNAFQYTHQGHVVIELGEDNIKIINHCKGSDAIDNQESSFGLGLALVEKICAKAGWHYQMQAIEGGYHTVVTFNHQAN